jgi:Tol biopolymer transport system component
MTKCVLLAIGSLLAGMAQHQMVMFHAPQWSPDGRWLTFTSNIDGDDEEVWLLSLDGVVKRKLTDNGAMDVGAEWLDADHITFQRHSSSGIEHFAIKTDGTGARTVAPRAVPPIAGLTVEQRETARGQDVFLKQAGKADLKLNQVRWAEQPSVSPNGTLVVFEQRDQPNDILSSDLALWSVQEQRLRVLTRGTDPSWSPDGRTVLFKVPDGSDNQLWVATIDVRTARVTRLAPGVHPRFSPDGRWIAFMGSEKGESIAMSTDRFERADIYVIGTDGSSRRCLTCGWK